MVFSDNLLNEQIEMLQLSYKQLFEQDEKGNIDVAKFIVLLEAMEQTMLDRGPNEIKQKYIVRMSSFAYKHLSAVISLRENKKAYRLKKIQHEIYRISADLIGFHSVSDKTYALMLSNFERFGIDP